LDKDKIEINTPIQIKINGLTEENYKNLELFINNDITTLPSDGIIDLTFPAKGLYQIQIKENNIILDQKNITVIDPNDTGIPDVILNDFTDAITQPTQITGSVSSDGLVKYSLSYASEDSNNFTIFYESSTPVTNGELGTLDPTLLNNGYYTLRLTGVGASGESIAETIFLVDGSMKIGNFSLDFIDMDINVNNFPLSVIRSYDSRNNKTSGDFGFGWNLGMSKA
jgi:hypothetical protein